MQPFAPGEEEAVFYPKAMKLGFSKSSSSVFELSHEFEIWSQIRIELNFQINTSFTKFSRSFPDERVRLKAVHWIESASKISSETMYTFLPLLVEALRFESFENSALAKLLLELSFKDAQFAFEIYWWILRLSEKITWNKFQMTWNEPILKYTFHEHNDKNDWIALYYGEKFLPQAWRPIFFFFHRWSVYAGKTPSFAGRKTGENPE